MSAVGEAAAFDYTAFVTRNLGFVNEAEQRRLREGAVFVCGVGGMGGTCVTALARAGVGRLAIADFDRFEISNLNRQLFATLDTVGRPKTDVVAESLRRINPELRLDIFGREWPARLDAILGDYPVVVNAMDDIASGIQLYRRAADLNATVIDAYTAPLPSVTVVRPRDPRPEVRLGFPTRAKSWNALTQTDRDVALIREIEYVLTHSSSRRHVELDVAAEMIAGRRGRMSFAPMVITTGCLMAFEAVALLIGRQTRTDFRGYFFNPWSGRVERPLRGPRAWLTRLLVRRFIRRLAP